MQPDMPDNSFLKSQGRIAALLGRLAADPPSCLLLEGGTEQERHDLSLYWAMILNCRAGNGPCFECRPCVQVRDEVFRDLYLLGPGQKINIDQVRALRTIYTQKPHFTWRVVVISEAHGLRGPTANALLKSLEEPSPGNSFVLLAPQRESLLPTLVSRSFILILNRKTRITYDEKVEAGFAELAEFSRTGRGWLDRTSGKDSFDLDQARCIVSRCKHELMGSMLRREPGSLFSGLSPQAGYQVLRVLKKAEFCLGLNYIRVDMVLEWLAMSLWKRLCRG